MIPKISVIIPCYNAEKFIRQCLISVLSSKFTDYEVIFVDDCSTDKSVAEAEKILPHFDGRLKIISTEKNSGGAGIPRNLGIKSATGKYITFVDSDDMILPTALGNFFEVAEEYNADVIHTEKFFTFQDNDFRRENLKLQSNEPYESLTEKIFAESKNLDERIKRYLEGKFFYVTWSKFYRRDFLIENKIEFPAMKLSEDMIFCFKCLCLAENYIRVPFVTNIHRLRKDSLSRNSFDTSEGTKMLIGVILNGLMILEEFIKERQDREYEILKFFIDTHFKFVENFFGGMFAQEIYKIFLTELSKPEFENFSRGKNILTAYLCTNKIIGK